ncbi:hypothetical protein ANCDUO_01802 [Ancylostoma duodenale]|uniref:Uncharacterized protein n=1 Tax=Ancylostoma duodenale TaxID=51022 RepID=A0A0C2HEB4_9BILA|nr:hypothetical protein ANCDUO_01802 [Ancylostoma duodenale]
MPNVIEATILTGKARGEEVFIPRIPMIPTDMPFDFKRLQFPQTVEAEVNPGDEIQVFNAEQLALFAGSRASRYRF